MTWIIELLTRLEALMPTNGARHHIELVRGELAVRVWDKGEPRLLMFEAVDFQTSPQQLADRIVAIVKAW